MGFLRKIFGNVRIERIKFSNFDPNDKGFGEQLLQYFQKIISQNMDVDVKIGWVKKDNNFPIITITKSMDEIQKIEGTKIVSIDFNIWANDKKNRNSITKNLSTTLKSIDFPDTFEPELSEIRSLDLKEKHGVYRCQLDLTIRVKVDINKKELKTLKEHQKKSEFYEKIVLGESSFGGEFLESKNNYILFNPSVSRDSLALIKKDKVLWKKKFENIVSFDFANDGSFAIVATQLTKKEMGKTYESGGHVYIITKEGKIKDIKLSCDGLSCSISPDSKYFGVTTMGPEWDVFYFDNKGKLIWKKKFNKRVGGIELTKDQIILYDKMHKETRKEVMKLNKKGNKVK
ncbi:hypothetical protein COU58_01015 [Candidatus Pacearchaeota archaeon CG10_big_fil_rev_8_21_14_0_10_32_42]|nr:MAG: hypothetical protein COU58_01015 [Candidatus Pacearchaeota archaeon CG10_big_fil_rev_8_21_14_0_10_32_42]